MALRLVKITLSNSLCSGPPLHVSGGSSGGGHTHARTRVAASSPCSAERRSVPCSMEKHSHRGCPDQGLSRRGLVALSHQSPGLPCSGQSSKSSACPDEAEGLPPLSLCPAPLQEPSKGLLWDGIFLRE